LDRIGSNSFWWWSNSFLLISHLFENRESALNLGDEILVRGESCNILEFFPEC
jgi:hypothetical protein